MPKCIVPMVRTLGYLFNRGIGNLTIAAVIVAAAFVLVRPHLGPYAPTVDGAAESDERGGSGVVIRSEAVCWWLPRTLIDIKQRELNASAAPTHHELKAALEGRRQENLWYAVTIRGHQVNGGVTEITCMRHPYREPEWFQELVDGLATATVTPHHELTGGECAAVVHILEANMSEQEFVEALRERHAR
jgi:hypothetical protein